MRSSYCLCVPPKSLKARIVEPEERVVCRQRLGKKFTAATNANVTEEELLNAVFSLQFVFHQILSM
jgi:hypothetical protein